MNDREHDKDGLAQHVRVDVSDARVERVWGRVSDRLGRRRGRGWAWAGAGLCVAAVAAIIIVRARTTVSETQVASVSAWEGAQLETAADALAVTLVDGSSLKLEPRSRVEVGSRTASAVKLVLARGRIACDVTHRPGRSFVVAAGGVEVRVIGTRFSVANEEAENGIDGTDGTRVEVRVERGVVEVRGAGPNAAIVRVEAGHSWSQVTKTEPLAGAVEVPVAVEADPDADVAAAHKAPQRAARKAAVTDARELFEQARSLWRAGRIDAAAQTYQTLLASHPRDPRAGLAAFELGRLRMDRLGDMPGAVRALEQAVALAPGAELREDALARLAAASAAAHDRSVCKRARDRYLADYPGGVHHRTVDATLCD